MRAILVGDKVKLCKVKICKGSPSRLFIVAERKARPADYKGKLIF